MENTWNDFLSAKMQDKNVTGLSIYFKQEIFPNFENVKSYLKLKNENKFVDKGIVILNRDTGNPLEFYPLRSILWIEFFVKK